MTEASPQLWKEVLNQTESSEGSSFWSGARTFLALLLPLGILVGAFYLCGRFYDRVQQEGIQRDYYSVNSFRLLPKQIAAELNSAHVALLQNEPYDVPMRHAAKIGEDLDDIFAILGQGGTPAVFASAKRHIQIEPVQTQEARMALSQAVTLYNKLHLALQGATMGEKPDPKKIAAAAELFDARSSRFLALGDVVRLHAMDESTKAIRQQELYLLTTVVTTLAVLLVLAWLVYHAQERRRQRLLARSNESLAAATTAITEAKQETDLILSTVRQGMLLMSSDYTISDQHSTELKEIFQTEHLAGFNFLNLLQRILTEKIFVTTRDYCAMLFDPAKKEKLLVKINPLARVEANFAQAKGGFATKHLEFGFRRILTADGAAVARVFVSVRDITRQVELEASIAQSEKKKERQFELLLGILHIGPAALQDFLKTVEEELGHINEALKTDDLAQTNGSNQTAALRARLDVVFRSVHNIKGNADFLKLEHFAKAAHTFEDGINELRNRPRLAGDDLLSVAIHQAELRSDLAETRDLTEKLFAMRRDLAPAAPAVSAEVPIAAAKNRVAPAAEDDLFGGVRTLTATLCKRLGKEADLHATPLDAAMPETLRRLVRDILIQLTRNSLVHGVEPAAERTALGKPPRATLSVSPAADAELGLPFGFTFRDDGRGLDPERIRARAVERGLISAQDAALMGDMESVALIFEPGFSTADEVTGDAGRGVGLDLVKSRIIDELGGDVFINSERGHFCEFTFLLPAPTAAPAESRYSFAAAEA